MLGWFWDWLWPANTIQPLPESLLKTKLNEKNIVIVGGTAGIGKALALSCLSRGANVSIVGRRQPEPSSPLAKAKFHQKDLSLIRNANQLASEIDVKSVDIVVFTNGIITSAERQETAEGIEMDLAVSFLSRMQIMTQWIPVLGTKRRGGGEIGLPRVFVMGYPGKSVDIELTDFNSDSTYKPFPAHMRTVVGNEALVSYIAEKSNGRLNTYGLNPGLIQTEIRDNYLGKGTWLSWIVEGLISLFSQTAEQYSERVLVHLMCSDEIENESKALFDNHGHRMKPNPFLLKGDNYQQVIYESERLLSRAMSAKNII